MLLCTSAWAETVTDVLNREFTGVANNAGYNDWSGKKSNSDAVYAGNSAGANNSIQLRTDKNNSGIVTTKSGGNVKEIVLTFQESTGGSRSVEIYGKSSAYLSPTELYADNTKGTLLGEIARSTDPITLTVNGDYQYIGLRSKTGALYLSEIKIEWEKVIVAKPEITFDPAAPYQGDNVTCSISCATEGASILYSTDGENYSNYPDGGFTLTENTTVYAKAKLGEDVSDVVDKSITFAPTVANIAELTALGNGKVFRMTGSATVVYTHGNFVYIKDESGSTLLYDVTNGNPEVAAGNTISNLKGVVSIYNGLFEVGKPASYTVEQTSVSVDPVVMAVDAISSANVNQYVKLEGVSLSDITNNNFEINGTLTGRNRFAVDDYPTVVKDKFFDVTGFVGINGETLQFWPTDIKDVTPEPPAVFGIKVTPTPADGQVFNAPVNVTIELLNATGEEAYFDYYLDNVKQNNYPEGGFTLYKTTAVKVVATNDDEDLTEVTWEGTYNIELPALAFEMTPAPGTYRGEQNITIACTNAVSDIVFDWTYTPTEGDVITGNQNNTTFTAAKSGVLRIFNVIEDNTDRGDSFDQTYNYTITEPLVIDGMIVFADNEAGDATTNLNSDGVIERINKGGNYIKSVSDIDKVYAGATGLKFSSSKASGTMTLNLANKWNATKISFIAKNWASDNGTFDQATMTVNGNSFDLSNEFDLYEVTLTEPQQIEAITFVANKRAYLKVINIEGEVVAPQTYTITLDKQPGDYTELVNVKATVEPALPEGATLTFKINDADPKEYNPEKGVNMLESGTITFTATDAAGNELATTSAEYKYIMRVFGDLNNDGVVDVTEVGTVVNLILGKLNN